MSWIKPRTEDSHADTQTVVSTPTNYNRDMNSPPLPASSKQPQQATGNAQIGQSIRIEGTLIGNEDLTIDGKVNGTIQLNGHSLSIGCNGQIEAKVSAKSVTVQGEVNGDISAEDKIQITDSGTVKGNLKAPRIALDDGATFAGSVDMGNND